MILPPSDQRIYTPKESSAYSSYKALQFRFDDASQYSYGRALEMLRRNAIVGALTDAFALWCRKAAHRYRNDDREILEFISGPPEGEEPQFFSSGQLTGEFSIPSVTEMLSSFPIFGNLFAEFTPRPILNELWGVGSLDVLPAGDYRYVRRKATDEEGYKGDLVGALYGNQVIPLEKALYLRHGTNITFGDPYGYPIYERLEPLAQGWAFILEEFVNVIGQQGGKKLIGLAEDGTCAVLGPNGLPLENNGEPVLVSNAWQLAQQLAQASKNNDVVVTSNKNKIEALQNMADGTIFEKAITAFRTMILIALLSPETVFLSAGSSAMGGAGMAAQHAETLLSFVESIAQAIAEQVQRVIIAPLVAWNFGPDANVGKLVPKNQDDPDRIELLRILSTFVTESLNGDEDVIARFRQLLY